jgi:hypothetical protein
VAAVRLVSLSFPISVFRLMSIDGVLGVSGCGAGECRAAGGVEGAGVQVKPAFRRARGAPLC